MQPTLHNATSHGAASQHNEVCVGLQCVRCNMPTVILHPQCTRGPATVHSFLQDFTFYFITVLLTGVTPTFITRLCTC